MTTLTCPKCRQGLPDDALDAGQCHLCGFPLDGPVVLGAPGSRTTDKRLLLAVVSVTALIAAVAGYVFFNRTSHTQPATEIAELTSPDPQTPVRYVAPRPHEPKQADTVVPADPPGVGDKGQPVLVVPEPPKKNGPRPVGVTMKVNPRIEPKRHFDHPNDTADVSDLNKDDRVVLTGKVRVLLLGSVQGKGVLDASGLVAEEIVIRADLNDEAQVLVNAPNGTITVGGYVFGKSKLTILAPGGVVTFKDTGRVAGSATVTATAKRLVVNCPLSGGAKINVTLTAGGSLKLIRSEEVATVTYKKAAATDPPPTIEKGELHGGARVLEAK